ncbi:tetraspanin-15-like [Durio zibethinus]|uniref:Tetraspanin-15-like n=1 Tax=Durio zibethinus TaxID=66656 RepID=A0A6P5XWC8_DURZI|nr:tetraspanin-15-like [Durio zibethinus]
MADNNANANPPEAVAVAVIEEKKLKQAEDTKKNIIPRKIFQVKQISGILSVASFVFSLPVLASVIWLLYIKSYDCEWLFKLPRLQIGISIGLICVFLICNGALIFLRTRLPMVGIIVVIVPLTVMLTVGLALLGANNTENRRIPATPLWFKMKIHDNSLWSNIKDCIYDTGLCQDLATTSMELKSYDFNMKKLSLIESGCCRPPQECHMQYVNATFWERNDKVANESDSYNADCDSWKNERDVLCYNCQTCRRGYIRTLQSKWLKLGVFLVCMAVLLITSHLSLFLVTMWELHVS